MPVTRKRDWFPIVATDLFCGLLSAVIILDATTPKEASAVGDIAFVEISYPAFGTADTCKDAGRVVFTFVDVADRLNTLDGVPDGVNVNGRCVFQSILPQVVSEGEISDPFLLVSEGPPSGDVFSVNVRSSRFPPLQCGSDGTCSPGN